MLFQGAARHNAHHAAHAAASTGSRSSPTLHPHPHPTTTTSYMSPLRTLTLPPRLPSPTSSTPAASCSWVARRAASTCVPFLPLTCSTLALCVRLHACHVCNTAHMSPLEHASHHVQQCFAAAAASIANDQNQLTAAVRSARVQLQAAAKKSEEARTAYGRVAILAAAAPNINIHDCAGAARAQRDELLSLAGQLQGLLEFLTVTCSSFDFAAFER